MQLKTFLRYIWQTLFNSWIYSITCYVTDLGTLVICHNSQFIKRCGIHPESARSSSENPVNNWKWSTFLNPFEWALINNYQYLTFVLNKRGSRVFQSSQQEYQSDYIQGSLSIEFYGSISQMAVIKVTVIILW